MLTRVILGEEKRRTSVSTIIRALVIVIVVLVAALVYVAANYSNSRDISSSLTSDKASNSLILFTADAYASESRLLEQGFTARTGIPMVTPVAAGTSTLAANIAAGDPVSVFLSVARSSVEGRALGSEFPGWAVAFAADQIGLAYTSASTTTSSARAVVLAYNTALSTNSTADWYDFFNNLTSGQVKVGISNPNDDPAGFRSWLVLELAGIAYDGGSSNQQYFVSRMLTNQGNTTGESAAALVPALKTGQINFLFIYKSDIASEGLSLIQLSNGVNLGLPSYDSFYSQATYKTKNGLETGSAIVLWLTVPRDSTNFSDSVRFVVYTIENYQTALKDFELVSISPAELYNTTGYQVPTPILALVRNGTLIEKGPV